jgi:hypothetical protein
MSGNRMRVMSLWLFFFLVFSCSTAFAVDVPVPWGAKLVRDDAVITGGEERKVRVYETGTQASELLKYYAKEMPSRGYTVFLSGNNNTIFVKDQDMVIVVVPPERDGKTTFIVTTANMRTVGDGFTTAQANCEPVAGVPVYPEAKCMRSTRMKSGASRSAAYFSQDDVGTIINYYRVVMPQHLWRLEREVNLNDTMRQAMAEANQQMDAGQAEMALGFMRGAQGLEFRNDRGNYCYIQVMVNPMSPGTSSITVTYEEGAKK